MDWLLNDPAYWAGIVGVIIPGAGVLIYIFRAIFINQLQSDNAELKRSLDELKDDNKMLIELINTINTNITALQVSFDYLNKNNIAVEQRVKRLEDLIFRGKER